MNRIDQLFRNKQKEILSVYYPAGYPTSTSLRPILTELQAQGIDMVEIGIPFSDPMADGVVIQQACTEALQQGMSLQLLFNQLTDCRAQGITLPLILMGYLNPILQYGFEAFCLSCRKVGVDGVIIPDLPFAEYMAEYRSIAEAHGIHLIMLISPETSDERILDIDAHTHGFIYMVSSAATTGAQTSFDEQRSAYFRRVAQLPLRNPLLVGFGISNRSTRQAASAHSSGVIVGSRFVQLLATTASPRAAVEALLLALNE